MHNPVEAENLLPLRDQPVAWKAPAQMQEWRSPDPYMQAAHVFI
jgi:hypothetical protein